jgi:type IV pilus assembly protein PilQ
MSWTVKFPNQGSVFPRCVARSPLRSMRCAALLSLALTSQLLTLPALATPAARFATDLRLEAGASESATDLVVEFTKPPTYTARYARAQRRLIVDISGAGVQGAAPALSEPRGLVAGAMIQQFDQEGSPTTRLIVTLAKDVPYAVRADGNLIRVHLGQEASASHKAPLPQARVAPPPTTSRVQNVTFSKHGIEERVNIELSAAGRFEQQKMSPTVMRLELAQTELPTELERALDVKAFGGGVSLVSAYATQGGGVVLEAEHAEHVEARLERHGTTLVWSFFEGKVPSSITGLAQDGKVARKTRTIFTEPSLLQPARPTDLSAALADTAPGEIQVSTVETEQAAAFEGGTQGAGRYTGRRVDLDFKDADIHNVLRLLADTGRVNIVAADNVAGTVTIRMKNVPWDQALDVVLQAKSLGMDRRGNIIRVAPQADCAPPARTATGAARDAIDPDQLRASERNPGARS